AQGVLQDVFQGVWRIVTDPVNMNKDIVYAACYGAIMRSEDGGNTWSMAEPLLTAGSPPHLLQHSSGLLISTYAKRSEPFAIMVALSADNGVTWETDTVIDDTPTNWDMGYASTVEFGNGDLFSVYYSRRPENTGSPVRWIRWSLK
ncbi:MAG: sialidase family protein, partial [Lentisphaerota bacterium]